jgi:hypothetical protein
MLTWNQSIERIIMASGGSPDLRTGIRWPWISRLPVVVTGFSGCGKTELWRRLTLKHADDKLSKVPDQGYYFREKKRSTLALTTIPGQLSDVQTILSDTFFLKPSTKVNGIVFVACYGYHFIWPEQVEAVTSILPSFSLHGLRDRNSLEELATFNLTCDFIRRKWSTSPEANRPKWLLVLCNKVDLYKNEADDANDYYKLGFGSDFGHLAGTLTAKLAGGGFRYHVLPTALRPRDYLFDSPRGNLKMTSGLKQPQCDASLKLLVDTLEELCGPQQQRR